MAVNSIITRRIALKALPIFGMLAMGNGAVTPAKAGPVFVKVGSPTLLGNYMKAAIEKHQVAAVSLSEIDSTYEDGDEQAFDAAEDAEYQAFEDLIRSVPRNDIERRAKVDYLLDIHATDNSRLSAWVGELLAAMG